jgi:hypothetical protein
MVIYISGPITGIENNNRDAFYARETELINKLETIPKSEREIINPMRIAAEVNYEWRYKRKAPAWADYMRACLKELARADFITFLPGWEESKGARLEKEISYALGIEEFEKDDEEDEDDDFEYQHGEG